MVRVKVRVMIRVRVMVMGSTTICNLQVVFMWYFTTCSRR